VAFAARGRQLPQKRPHRIGPRCNRIADIGAVLDQPGVAQRFLKHRRKAMLA
jgi:hypothetical protein